MFTIAVQVRRLDSLEPVDETFVFGKHADLESSRVAKCRGLSPVLRYECHRATSGSRLHLDEQGNPGGSDLSQSTGAYLRTVQ